MYNLSNLSKEELELLDECLDLWHDFVRDSKPEFAPGPDQADLNREKQLHKKIQKLLGINEPHEETA